MVDDVHVVPGDSAAGGLRLALGEADDRVVVGLRDPLSCGPLLATPSLEEWASSRQRFWSEVLAELVPPDGFFPDSELLRHARTITLWLGNGLGDQLTLPWLCWVLDVLAIPRTRLRVVQFPTDFVPRHRVPSLGALSPEMIRRHPPAAPLDDRELHAMREIWAALTNSDPNVLSSLLVTPSRDVRPFGALARLAWRYPHAATGLSFWDRALLANVSKRGPRAAAIVAHTFTGPGWDADPVGDDWLLWRIRRLAGLGAPLLRFDGDGRALRGMSVELTPAGRDVLDLSRNALDLNPLDDWVGGVHLDSRVGGTWVTQAGLELNDMPLPSAGLQLTWRSLVRTT